MDNENISGLLVCTDFEKDFDSLNWKFMLKTLENFNFGPSVNQWVNTFYSDISACTINNGYTSGYFKLERGVRQGDPLSPYLFILAMEVLAHVVREEKSIRGIKLGETELKIVLFADDNSGLFADKISAKTFLNLVNEFEKYSGLKLNIEKTEVMWLGSAKHNLDKPLDLKWSDKVIKILGIHFGHNKQEMVRANYESKVQSLKTTLAIWKMRDLTLNGRILISKVLGLSKFDYTLSVLTMPKDVIWRVNDIIWNFIWKGKKKGKIRREVLFCEYEDGGQQMLDLETRIETARIKCLKRYFYGVQHHWKVLFNQFFSVYGGIQNLLCGNLDSKTLSEFPQFQQEVIRTWSKLSYNNKKFIWNNKAITVNKCTVFNRSMFQCGIWFPEDLFEKGRLTPFDEWCKRGLDKKYYILWRGLATTVLKENKQKPVQGEQNLWMLRAKVDGEEVVRPLESISSKEIYLLLIQKNYAGNQQGRKPIMMNTT